MFTHLGFIHLFFHKLIFSSLWKSVKGMMWSSYWKVCRLLASYRYKWRNLHLGIGKALSTSFKDIIHRGTSRYGVFNLSILLLCSVLPLLLEQFDEFKECEGARHPGLESNKWTGSNSQTVSSIEEWLPHWCRSQVDMLPQLERE